MSVQNSAELQTHSQDQRVKELSAELHQVRSDASQSNQNFQQANSELQGASAQMGSYMKQIDALNRQIADIQKCADLQRQDFEKEIGKLRRDQAELMRHLKSHPLGGELLDHRHLLTEVQVVVMFHSVLMLCHPTSSCRFSRRVRHRMQMMTMCKGIRRSPPGLPPGGPPDDLSDSD